MGARLLRPKSGGPVLDAAGVAELLGCSTSDVYAMTRAGDLPQPLNVRWASAGVRRWRWSRKAIQGYADGRFTPTTPLLLDSDRGAA